MSGAPLPLSLYVWQGQLFNYSLGLQTPAGAAVNLTGYTASLMVRTDATASDIILELSTANGGILISAPTTGILVFNLTGAATFGLPTNNLPQNWQYDLVLVDSGGNATREATGLFVVNPSVNRPHEIPWWWWPMQDQPFPPLPGPPAPAPPWYTSAQAVGWQTASLIPPPGYPSGTTFPPPLDTAWPLPPGWPVGLSYPLPFGTPFPTLPVPSWWPVTIPYTPPTSPTNPLWYL